MTRPDASGAPRVPGAIDALDAIDAIDARGLAAATLVAHALLAAGVLLHARRAGRNGPRWAGLTLLTGVVGVAGYLSTGD